MKKKENVLVLLSILCAVSLVPFGAFDEDFSLKIRYLTRIWLILFVFGLLKTFYPKWKAKFRKWNVALKKKRKYVLITGIAVLTVVCAFKVWNIKGERVQALKRNQAVMAMVRHSYGGCFGGSSQLCVINREGRWKQIDVYDERYEKIAGGEWKDTELTVKILDNIMASSEIPYKLGKVLFSSKELNRVIRRRDVSYYYKSVEVCESPRTMLYHRYIYYNIQGVKDRDVYRVGKKAGSERWEDGKEVAELDATYKKWIRAMEEASWEGQELLELQKEEKQQVVKGIALIVVALAGLVLILGICDGYMLRGWWQKSRWKYQKSNLSFVLGLVLVQLIFHIRLIVENATIFFNIQFFWIYCFTMGVWSFWEMGNWRRYCGITKDKEKYKGVYYKGNLFLATMGCCWFGALINHIMDGAYY